LSKQKGLENQKLGDVKSKATRVAGLHYLKKVEKVFQQLDDSEEAINKKTKEASSWWGGQQQGLLGPEDPALSKKEALSDINSLRALLLMSVEATFELLDTLNIPRMDEFEVYQEKTKKRKKNYTS
jgi:hypothetical protein